MTATAENADPATPSVKKEESIISEFLKSDEEVNAHLSTPFVTGLIKQEEVPAVTKLGSDSEASSPSDLKKETCEAVYGEMKEAEEYEHVEVGGVKDGGVELTNEDYLDFVSGGDEEMKQAFTSDVSMSRMEYVLEKVSGVDKVLYDEDGSSPLWECKVVPDEDEKMATALVGNIPIEIIMDEVWPKEDKLTTPELVNGSEDDGPPPGWDWMIIKDEVETVTSAPVESTQLEIKMEDVPPEKGTFSAPGLENDADGPPPGWEETSIEDKVEPVPPALVESVPLEIKPGEEQPTKDMLPAPGLENDADGPLPGWEAMVVKNEVNPMPPAPVDSIVLDINTEEMLSTEDTLSAPGLEIEDIGNGTPSGWEAVATKDFAAEESLVKIEKVKEENEEANPLHGEESVAHTVPGLENDDDDNAPLPAWEAVATEDCDAEETLVKQEPGKEEEKEEEHQPSGEESDAQTTPRPLLPFEAPSPTMEMGQVVCGSCRSLLSYPKGAKYVQCLCCQTVSLVLEAHQVGQVYCGGCSTLLMYRFGSPAVKCSGCKFITQITPQNHRPPLSEQGVTLQSQLAQLRPRSKTNLAQ